MLKTIAAKRTKGFVAALIGGGLLILSLSLLLEQVVFSATVSLTATVGTSITCTLSTSTTAFGTLTTGAVTTAVPNVTSTVTTNDCLGFTLNISDTGLATSSPAYTIASTTGVLAAGTEGWGIQATTTTGGSGGTVTLLAKYNVSGNTVGSVGASAVLASSTVAVTSRNILVSHLAAISASTQAGSYSDTITYSCTGN